MYICNYVIMYVYMCMYIRSLARRAPPPPRPRPAVARPARGLSEFWIRQVGLHDVYFVRTPGDTMVRQVHGHPPHGLDGMLGVVPRLVSESLSSHATLSQAEKDNGLSLSLYLSLSLSLYIYI